MVRSWARSTRLFRGLEGDFDKNDGNAASGERGCGAGADRGGVDAVGEAFGEHAEQVQGAGEQGFGAAIERLAMEYDVARADIG